MTLQSGARRAPAAEAAARSGAVRAVLYSISAILEPACALAAHSLAVRLCYIAKIPASFTGSVHASGARCVRPPQVPDFGTGTAATLSSHWSHWCCWGRSATAQWAVPVGTGAALNFGVWVCVPCSSSGVFFPCFGPCQSQQFGAKLSSGRARAALPGLHSPWGTWGQLSLRQGTRVSQGRGEGLGPVTFPALVHVSSPFQGPDGRAQAPSRAAAG